MSALGVFGSRYPKVEVFVDHVEGSTGGYDRVQEIQVDGVPWAVEDIAWHNKDASKGMLVTLSVWATLRITERPAGEADT